jgi:hypothetical protein
MHMSSRSLASEFLHRRGVALAAAAAVAVFAAASAHAAAADPVRLRYDVYNSGFRVLSFTVNVTEEARSYRIDGQFETRGVVDVLMGLTSRIEAEGEIGAGGNIRPRRYASFSRVHGTNRHIVMDYRPDGSVAVDATPDDEERTPVSPAQIANTVDALSAAVQISRSLAETGGCERTIPVFDGRRRYDMQVSDRGEQVVTPSRYSLFAGPAHACYSKVRRIAGYTLDAPKKPPRDDGTFWLTRLTPDGPPVPVRMEFDGNWGTSVVHLVEVTAGGTTRRLAE